MKKIDIKLTPNKRVFFNPKSYLKFLKSEKENIEQVSIQPPVLGKKGFGAIEVKMKKTSFYEKSAFGF